jgi:hypothetical protein
MHGHHDNLSPHQHAAAFGGHAPTNSAAETEGTDLAAYGDETSTVTRSAPWMAIALMGHAVVLLLAAFVATAIIDPPEVAALNTQLDEVDQPVPPEEKPQERLQDLEKPVESDEVVEAVQTITEARDETVVDTPSEIISERVAESPSPYNGPNTAIGLSGGAGGGGPGGDGPSKFPTRGNPKFKRDIGPPHVDAGLQWLADHQNLDGHWSAANFLNDSNRTAHSAKVTYNIDFAEDMAAMRGETHLDKGDETYSTGLTGLALLAFLGDGHTNRGSKFSRTVDKAVKYILRSQDPEGCFGARDDEEFVYCHAICSMALAEAYAMTSQAALRGPVKRSVDFIVRAQNPGLGWRYGVQPLENDSSVTAWMVLALKSAKMAEIDFDARGVYSGAIAWYDKVTAKDDQGYERTGYVRPGGGNARLKDAGQYDMNSSMDACNLMVRMFTGETEPTAPKARQLATRIARDRPTWGKKVLEGGTPVERPYAIDYYYWYYASLALFQVGGDQWTAWEKELMFPVLMDHQRGFHKKDYAAFGKAINGPAYLNDGRENPAAGRWLLDEHGSWDPVDAWGSVGGRVYATAINTLTLQVYYRYAKLSAKS